MKGTNIAKIEDVLTFLVLKMIISCSWFFNMSMGSVGTSKNVFCWLFLSWIMYKKLWTLEESLLIFICFSIKKLKNGSTFWCAFTPYTSIIIYNISNYVMKNMLRFNTICRIISNVVNKNIFKYFVLSNSIFLKSRSLILSSLCKYNMYNYWYQFFSILLLPVIWYFINMMTTFCFCFLTYVLYSNN